MKEKVITVLLGLGAGTLFGGLILLGPKLLDKKINFDFIKKNAPTQVTPAPLTPQPTVLKNDASLLTVNYPEDNSFSSDQSITVSGKAPAAGTVFIFGPADEKIASVSADGTYSVKLKLEDGENEINVTLLGDKMQTIKKSVTLEISQ